MTNAVSSQQCHANTTAKQNSKSCQRWWFHEINKSNVRKLLISHAKPSLNGSVVKLDQLTTGKESINKYSDMTQVMLLMKLGVGSGKYRGLKEALGKTDEALE